jgi:Zn-dependent M28 family amino/carboxypeptidase
MLNLDMIGFAVNDSHTARIESNTTHQNLINELSAAAALHAPELAIITSTNANGGSDYVPFLQAGVPTAFTWENGASVYPHYHLASDVPANMSRARVLAGGILKMAAAVLAARAGIVGFDGFKDGFEFSIENRTDR